MVARYKSKRRRELLISRGLLLVLIVIAIMLARGVWDVFVKERQTQERLEQVQKEHEELEERSVFLENEVGRLSTEIGVEEEIRRQYGLGKEGERVFVIVDAPEEQATSTEKGFWNYVLFWID